MRDILPELNGKDYIEALNEKYDIRFCHVDEIDELVEFLRRYWRYNHIFVKSRILLDWQHLDKVNNRYNFVIAKHRESGEIHSILGFVPTQQYDHNIYNLCVWPCIWKSRDDVKVKGLGVSLYYYLKENLYNLETFSILGISTIALNIYKHWNFETGTIKQYYMLNQNFETYNLLNNYSNIKKDKVNIERATYIELDEKEFIDFNNSHKLEFNRYKSVLYYVNRFYKHPIYKYNAYIVSNNSAQPFVIFTRCCEGNNSKCLRIVDFIGNIDKTDNIYANIQKLLFETNSEYIDLINVGDSKEKILNMGFNDMDDSSIVIPNYFEPFEKSVVKLDYAYRSVSEESRCQFVKADADQDRPNVI